MSTVLPAASASASGHSSEASYGGGSDRRNVPVPDELYAVRTEIKRLEERELELKRLLIENPDLREGASYLAEIKTVKSPRTDLKELKHFHPDLVAEYTYQLEQTRVVLLGVTEDGELVNPRKLKAT